MTNTKTLRKVLRMVSHYALAAWMRKQGYPFDYCYFVIFNKQPTKR